MNDEWIQVSYTGNEWCNTTVYVNPNNETAKICTSKCTHWGYHDESEWDDTEKIVTIEEALAEVYPNEYAISVILKNINKDYSEILKRLAEKKG